jgi:hypothetical protein
MSISIRPNRRFPIHCSVTYNAGLFLRLPLGNLLALLILLLSSGAAYAEWVKINENDTFTVYTDPDTIRPKESFQLFRRRELDTNWTRHRCSHFVVICVSQEMIGRCCDLHLLEPLLLQVIHVEPMIDHTMLRDEGRNILFHVFLQLRWEIAQT